MTASLIFVSCQPAFELIKLWGCPRFVSDNPTQFSHSIFAVTNQSHPKLTGLDWHLEIVVTISLLLRHLSLLLMQGSFSRSWRCVLFIILLDYELIWSNEMIAGWKDILVKVSIHHSAYFDEVSNTIVTETSPNHNLNITMLEWWQDDLRRLYWEHMTTLITEKFELWLVCPKYWFPLIDCPIFALFGK